jgi:hypothetical protein
MPKSYAVALAIVAGLMAVPAYAGDDTSKPKVVFEAAVKAVSDDAYMELVQQAWSKGWRFTHEDIEKGLRRHFEEFKLQLIGEGYTILPGEAGT